MSCKELVSPKKQNNTKIQKKNPQKTNKQTNKKKNRNTDNLTRNINFTCLKARA